MNPNFGWIEVKGNSTQGAAVYVDNACIGKAPCRSEALKSGEHTVRIAKEMYAPFNEKIVVSDNMTTTLSPTLTADFAKVTLTVDADAEIWVNEEKKGTRSWTGNLSTGTYRIECRQASHETKATTIEITHTMDGQTIALPAPKPIYGMLNVESTPDFAKIFVDGKEIQFTCNVPNAQLEIDGQRMNSANGIYMLTYGQHSLKATAIGYIEYTTTLENLSRETLSRGGHGSGNVKNAEQITSFGWIANPAVLEYKGLFVWCIPMGCCSSLVLFLPNAHPYGMRLPFGFVLLMWFIISSRSPSADRRFSFSCHNTSARGRCACWACRVLGTWASPTRNPGH